MPGSGFTGKNVPKSDVVYEPSFSSQMGPTFANKLNEYKASIDFVGLSEPSEGKHPFDTFKIQDPASMSWASGKKEVK